MVNNIFLYKRFIGVKKINGHSGVNFSFKAFLLLEGWSDLKEDCKTVIFYANALERSASFPTGSFMMIQKKV